MAYVLGKDLDNWNDSLAAREPYSLSDTDKTGAQYITGEDLVRSARISSEWKDPIALSSQAHMPISIPAQIAWSTWHGMEDTIHNLPYNVENVLAQRTVELLTGKEKEKSLGQKLYEGTEFGQIEKVVSTLGALGIIIPGLREEAKTIREKAKTYDEMVDLLKERDYPLAKYARRVIADNTAHVENRQLVRELYNQAQGIDSSAWYNQAATIIGAMIPTITASRLGYSTAKALGASRANAINTALNIAKGYMTAEMAGQYAEETAAQYLSRTGDKNFEKFTAKDASGLSAAAYGAIGAQIEFIGGIEPIMAGALQKVGLRSGLIKAGLKIAAGEASEELLQNVTELLMRKMEGSTDKTWGEGIKDALNGAVWGAFIGGLTGSPAFYVNRRNLVRGIKKAIPQVSDAQATQIADAMIDTAAEASSQDPTLRNNLREKIAFMYKNIDLDNKEDRIDAITDLEYALATMDATDRGIDLTEHEIFQGEVTPIGWFRAGIPEAQRTEIQAIIDNITDLQTQLETLNKAKEKDWAKIEEIENKLAQANQYVLDKMSDLISKESFTRTLEKLEKKYVGKQKKKAGIPVDFITTPKQTSSHDYGNVQAENIVQETKNGKIYQYISDKQDGGRIRLLTNNGEIIGQIDIRKNGVGYIYVEPKYRRNKNAETLWKEAQRFINPEQVVASQRDDVSIEDTIKFWEKQGFVFKGTRGTRKIDTSNQLESFPKRSALMQSRTSGKGKDIYRGAYIPQFRFIQRANKMDASTLSHEMAHDWFETNFYRYRNEKMSKDFMKAWGALEKALGVTEKDKVPPRKASEAFARAYEAWITSNEDWHKLINVDDKDKDAVAKLMQDYQNSLRDIYNDISNPYFKETWGKLGELKPELKAWFDRVVNITDLDVLVERGEMTEEQATNEKLNRAIYTVIENTTDEETAQTLKEVRTLNDTQRYEVEGGSPNSIQRRLSNLAREIDENNMISKGSNYDTRRDMIAVAESADNFVKTRLDDALAIINGQMAEVEGLFKEDLYTALERLAIENGDLGLIDELKNSEIANRLAKELGQRVAGFRNFKQSTDLDVVSALKSLDNKFNEALKNKKAKQEYESALKSLEESIKQQDKVADKELDSFLKDLECK